ncbi:hypothetical protein FDZ73_22090 [bacterium]|nr:MAG: hypothetical protein FDZ73_22090 [bacterium]
MNAKIPDEDPQDKTVDPVIQEKIHEFCYELALALRRITGRKVERDTEDLPVDMSEIDLESEVKKPD